METQLMSKAHGSETAERVMQAAITTHALLEEVKTHQQLWYD